MCRVTSCTALGDVTTADKLPLADAVYSMHSAPLLWCAVARISIKAVPAAAAGVRLRPSPAPLSPQKRDQLVVQQQRAAGDQGNAADGHAGGFDAGVRCCARGSEAGDDHGHLRQQVHVVQQDELGGGDGGGR
jgi:hypothetical protein